MCVQLTCTFDSTNQRCRDPVIPRPILLATSPSKSSRKARLAIEISLRRRRVLATHI